MFWIIAIILVLSLLSLIYYTLIKPQLFWYYQGVKQNVPIPILGDYLSLLVRIKTMYELVRWLYSQCEGSRYSGIYTATYPTLLIRDPDLIKELTVKEFDHFTDHRTFFPPSTDKNLIWTKNLLFLKGSEWRKMRSTISPSFTSSKMKAMFALINQSGKQYIDFYLGQNKNVIDVEVKDSFSRFANDVIANCAFGIICDSLKEPENEFYLIVKDITSLGGFVRSFKFIATTVAPKLAKTFNMEIFSKRTSDYFIDIVKRTIKHREDNNIVRPDMLNLLMEAKKGRLKYEEDQSSSKSTGFATVEESTIGRTQSIRETLEMTDAEMAAQVMFFFFAGLETVSTTMMFMAYELAKNPEIQERLRKEFDELKTASNELNYDDLARLKYLDMVVSETLRRYPAAVAMDRICTKPYIIEPQNPSEKPVHFKIGQRIWLPIVALQNDPKYFPEPERFDPERFSEENKVNIRPYTYLPFGVGPRNCIGSRFALMEVKIMFYHLISNFEIKICDKTELPVKLTKLSFTLNIDGGFRIGLKKRDELNGPYH